jgi:DNA-binding transcriptional LysR family regulator
MLIPPDKLARMDLNLLVSLQVLIEERNVTRAAGRLFITQPAMSRTLSRLRDLFDDPLFTRVARGLVPTPRCEELEQQLPDLLDAVGNVVTRNEFAPATFEHTFRIAVVEKFGQSLFGPLLAELQQEAPHIVLQAMDASEGTEDLLAQGSIDFAIDHEKPDEVDIDFLPLLSNRPVIIASPKHPLAGKKKLKLKDVLAYNYVRCFPVDAIKSEPIFDSILSELGEKRHCFFHTSNLLTALEVVHNSDALLAGPEFILNSELLENKFVKLTPPNELADMGEIIGLSQHRRTLTNPAHQWLTEKIANITATHWTTGSKRKSKKR